MFNQTHIILYNYLKTQNWSYYYGPNDLNFKLLIYFITELHCIVKKCLKFIVVILLEIINHA